MPEGITFTTQEEIDNFSNNYPNCDSVEGEVIISGADITNLDGLNEVTRINGTLCIGGLAFPNYMHNPNLVTLTGLDHLVSCGELRIIGNDSLTGIEGLNSLSSVDGNVHIGYWFGANPYLKHLQGLNNLESIGGNLIIDRNFILGNLFGLESLVSVEGSLIIGTAYGTVAPMGNPLLMDLSALSSLSSIGNECVIWSNLSLKNLSGLEGITSIGSLYIEWNDSLSTCHLLGRSW